MNMVLENHSSSQYIFEFNISACPKKYSIGIQILEV